MKEFILFFRMDIISKDAQPSPAQMEMYLKQWDEWITGIRESNRLAPGGNHLSTEGKVLMPGNEIAEGPYVRNNESVAGYIIIKAKNLNKAVSIAKDCPILQGKGTSVEVREIAGSR